LASLESLKRHGLHQGVFPILDVLLSEACRGSERERFIHQALLDTDRRVSEGKPVAPSFMLACVLWHDVLTRWAELRSQGESSHPALVQAVDAVFDARIGDISGRGKLGADMREIWLMQPRFERRSGQAPFALVEQSRFRAGFDFLRLRADVGEVQPELAEWWEDFSLGSDDERSALMEVAREADQRARKGQESNRSGRSGRPSRPGRSEHAAQKAVAGASPRRSGLPQGEGDPHEAPLAAQGQADGGAPADEALAGEPPRKRRRRRRRPAQGQAEGAGPGASGPDSEG
jgi:poly(A) polymerase